MDGPSSLVESSPAASSYPSSLLFPYSRAIQHHQWRYDVFVSFCGEDTRKKFKSHLYNALEQAGIDHFDDEVGETRGSVVGEMLAEGIRHSRIALVVFSRNYAGSMWCLEELVEILEWSNRVKPFKGQYTVHPIFYEVNPTDVRKQEGHFGEMFAACASEHADRAEAWKHALTVAGNLSGWHLTNDKDEREFIDKVVRQLSDQYFYERSSYFVKHPIINDNIEEVIALLKLGSQDVRVIGLYGISGTGKTTMAKIICQCLSDAFGYVQVFEFIRDENIREILNKRRHKMLLVVDNVNDDMIRSHVNILIGECNKRLVHGSRIIIISREEKILRDLKVNDRYMILGFGSNESLQLFNQHAFPTGNKAPKGFEKLARDLLHYSGGHPSWVKVMGDFLSQKSQLDEWSAILESLVRNPYLDSVGIHTSSECPSYPLQVGPFGGQYGGSHFDDNIYTGIRRISVSVSWVLETLTVDYDLNGCVVRQKHGRIEQGKKFTVELNFPDEYLISISGSVLVLPSAIPLVQSLKFQSNKNIYGPFGQQTGNSYNFTVESKLTSEKIVGFFGRRGSFIDCIGANFGPIEQPYPFKAMGPFGGQGGRFWSDGKHKDIRQLKVMILDSVITSIITLYDDHTGRRVGPYVHGDTNAGLIHTIKLDFPYEYLTSVSGYFVEDSEKAVIQSLTFRSNINKIYKIGKEPEKEDPSSFYGTDAQGRHFHCPSTNGKIVGFFGRSSQDHLESIGAYFDPIPHIYPLKKIGPIGGDQGHAWDDEANTHIRKITITSGLVIDSVMFLYDNDGVRAESIKHGGVGGEHTYTIELSYPNEQIISVSGYFGEFDGVTVIQSLTFQSTKKMYGPYGHRAGTFFSFPADAGKIVGFYGSSDKYLNSIGAHVKVRSRGDYPFKSIGFCGCGGGEIWDDGKHSDVSQIEIAVRADLDAIQSIQFGYESNGSSEKSCVHGSHTIPGRRHRVKLAYPREYLTSVSGFFEHDSPLGIRSLTLYSNERMFGPFGAENGKYFSFPMTGGKIIGFYGKCGSSHLNSIGAYFEPVMDLYPMKVVGPFGGPTGKPFEDRGFTGVRRIFIASGSIVDHLHFEYDKYGHPVVSDLETFDPQIKPEEVVLNYPNEYLTSIFGYIRTHQDQIVIGSVTFRSNVRCYGPYGEEKGKFFWFPSTGSKIVGFHGRSGAMLNSIGVYLEAAYRICPPRSMSVGGDGGIVWDDGYYTDVRQIKILVGTVVESIIVEYDNDGLPIQCSQHGEMSGWESNWEVNEDTWRISNTISKALRWLFGRPQEPQWYTVKLNFPMEYLISISGYTGQEVTTGEEVVQSLKITSNRRTYGPYGTERGTRFQLPGISDGRIVGFYGRSGSHLCAIGVHLEPYDG